MAKGVYVGVNNFEKVNLPSGYTQVEYIESSGTQYIDTGFIPNQDTRVTLYAYNTSASSGWTYGVWESSSSKQFCFSCLSTYSFRYGTSGVSLSTVPVGSVEVDQNKNAYNLNGTTGTITPQTFTCSNNMYLFCINANGSPSGGKFSGKLYSCKIYDNGTLVRNYIPCTNASGTAGLYDLVGAKFYGNSGTGTFTAGGTQKGVARKVKKIYTGISGVSREVQKGYVGVSGVARQFFAGGTPIKEFPVGTIVKLNVNGTPREFIVVNQGIPSNSSLYDSSCNGTWLMMKDLYENRNYGGSNNNYENSTIHSYLNGAFLRLLDSNIQSIIKQVKIPYRKGTGNGGTTVSGSNGLSTKIFLPSGYELGWTTGANDRAYLPKDGATLSYFSGLSDTDVKRIAYYNGTATVWWLRSPQCSSDGSYWCVIHLLGGVPGGYLSSAYYTTSYGIRPMLVLPFDTPVQKDMLVV